ncbi:MAG: 4-hydroxy-tetrahydrodipicolinate reductase [Promethearchaeota archaeon]
MLKLGILGVAGSMGRHIARLAIKDEEIKITKAYEIPQSPYINVDVGTLVGESPQNVKIESIENLSSDLASIKENNDFPDVFTDFTVASATEKNAPMILEHCVSMVIGTTGLSKQFHEELNELVAKTKTPLVIGTNMSVGVNVVFNIAAKLAKILRGWEIEIIEMHHHRKLDAPSGTALTILEKICEARDLETEKITKFGRSKGKNPRTWGEEEIGVHAVRAGDIVGDHIILYAGDGERIELKHQAHSRDCFASGALKAAKFLLDKKGIPKIFSMKDVLGFQS